MRRNASQPCILRCAVAIFALTGVLHPSIADAQAWLPKKGEGSFGLSYAFFNGGDHLYPTDSIDGQSTRGYTADGDRWFLGDESNHSVSAHLDLGLSERLAVSTSASWVAARYEGNAPWNLNLDDGQHHATIQDARIQLRALTSRAPVRLVPYAAIQFPISRYETVGHAAPGRHLVSWSLGVYVGRSLSPWLPRMYAQLRYGHSSDEENQGFRLNRNDVDIEIGYRAARNLRLRFLSALSATSGGSAWGSDGSAGHGSSAQGELDATISQIRSLRAGLGLSYTLFENWTASILYISILDGENTLDGDFFSVSLGLDFTTPWAPRKLWL